MSVNFSWGLFPWLTIDHRAAQTALDRRAAVGWRLKKCWLGIFAQYEPTEQRDLHYAVDLADAMFKEEPDYLTLCADAGWDEVCSVRYMRIYASKPGVQTTPIQTDGGLEYQRFCRLVLRRMLIGLAILVPFLLLLLYVLFSSGSSTWGGICLVFVSSFAGNFLALTWLPLALGGVVYLWLLLHRLLCWRRLRGTGDPIPVPNRWAVRMGCCLCTLGYLLLELFSATAILDLGTTANVSLWPYLLGLVIAIPLASHFKSSNPRRRVLYFKNPVLYMVGAALLLRLAGISGEMVPFTVPMEPVPVEELLSADGRENRRNTWLGAYERVICLVERSDGQYFIHATRFRSRLPWLADGLAQGLLVDYYGTPLDLEPVPGLPDVLQATGKYPTVVVRRGGAAMRAGWAPELSLTEPENVDLLWALFPGEEG